MSKAKKGKVVRLSDFAYEVINENKSDSLSVRETIDNMIAQWGEMLARVEEIDRARPLFVLRSDLHRTLKEARGEAVVRAVRSRKEIDEVVKVRSV
jgi:hypothetical protein